MNNTAVLFNVIILLIAKRNIASVFVPFYKLFSKGKK
jgi:hypothetical protein